MSEHHHSHHSGHSSHGHHKHGYHRHHKHHGIRHWLRHNKKLAAISTVMILSLVLVGSILFVQQQKKQKALHVKGGNTVDLGAGYREIQYKGKKYRYNSLITSVLYAGVDSDGELKASEQYTVAPRADSIYLIVMNQKTKKISIIAISRDTMTKVRRYTLSGFDRGTYTTHLGYAYTYGNGGEVSCEGLREAVSTLFHGIPITEYAVTNRASMPEFNKLVGGVDVIVPNDELVELHPEWSAGAVVHIQDADVEDYLRHRDTKQDLTNEGRMERQKSYILPYVEKLGDLMKKDAGKIWSKIENSENYLQTSITKNKYLSMVNLMNVMEFTDSQFYKLEGENVVGSEHDEFYVDQEALMDRIVELFYEEV